MDDGGGGGGIGTCWEGACLGRRVSCGASPMGRVQGWGVEAVRAGLESARSHSREKQVQGTPFGWAGRWGEARAQQQPRRLWWLGGLRGECPDLLPPSPLPGQLLPRLPWEPSLPEGIRRCLLGAERSPRHLSWLARSLEAKVWL